MTTVPTSSPRWLLRGDIDGFLGLGLDSFITILLAIGLCRGVLGFPDKLITSTILPAVGASVLVGNGAYALQAWWLGRQEGSYHRTALPYGVNTISLLAYVFLVMLPVKAVAMGEGMAEADAAQLAWRAGLMACLGSGLLEVAGAFLVAPLQRWLPRSALLASLAGIAMGFLGLGFLLQVYEKPVLGLAVLAVVLITYFGRVRLPLPGGLLAVLLGLALAWSMGLVEDDPLRWQQARDSFGLQLPHLQLGALWQARAELLRWMGVILPMGLFNVLGSMQNVESAAAAGDDYPVRNSLLINGVGTMVAALLGSCFPTTIYIGHPSWKALGARLGYSWINGLAIGVSCFLGLFALIGLAVPIQVGVAIIVYVGIVITAQSLQVTPKNHAPAVVLGIMVGLASWGAFLLKAGVRAGGGGQGQPFGDGLLEGLEQVGVAGAGGLFSLEQGGIITAMLLTALMVYVIEQRFLAAAGVAAASAVLSWFGVIHAWRFTPGDTALQVGWGVGAEWAYAYGIMALLLLATARLHRSRP